MTRRRLSHLQLEPANPRAARFLRRRRSRRRFGLVRSFLASIALARSHTSVAAPKSRSANSSFDGGALCFERCGAKIGWRFKDTLLVCPTLVALRSIALATHRRAS